MGRFGDPLEDKSYLSTASAPAGEVFAVDGESRCAMRELEARALRGMQKRRPDPDRGDALQTCEEGISMRLNPLVDLATTYSPAS